MYNTHRFSAACSFVTLCSAFVTIPNGNWFYWYLIQRARRLAQEVPEGVCWDCEDDLAELLKCHNIRPRNGANNGGVTITGEDRKSMESQAVIGGSSIIVSNAGISKPAAVRYAWADRPACNLYKKNGLPASPFWADD